MLTRTQMMQDISTTGVALRADARVECARTLGLIGTGPAGVTTGAYVGRTTDPSLGTAWSSIAHKPMTVPAFHNRRPLHSP